VAPGATAGPTPTAVPGNTGGGISTPVILGALALIAIVVAGFWYMRRRRPKVEVE
jgi:LPXTG-motif cell wall-anchored protein